MRDIVAPRRPGRTDWSDPRCGQSRAVSGQRGLGDAPGVPERVGEHARPG